MIIKFVDNAPVISEFCIEEGAPNPYVALITNYGITGNLLKFYSIGAMIIRFTMNPQKQHMAFTTKNYQQRNLNLVKH